MSFPIIHEGSEVKAAQGLRYLALMYRSVDAAAVAM